MWLKIIEIYSFTVLEARNPKLVPLNPNQSVNMAALTPEALGKNESILCLFQILGFQTVLDLWPHHSNLCLCGRIILFCLCYLLLPLL